MRKTLPIFALLLTSVVCAWAQSSDHVIARCPTLARVLAAGQLDQIRDPVFADKQAARRFALICGKVANELTAVPGLSPKYTELAGQAVMAAEFLTSETHMLATSNINSVVTLRESVKIDPPLGFVYVKKYPSLDSMPPFVRRAFEQLKRGEGMHVKGVTYPSGRYVALLITGFDKEVRDNLSHEMVHAYLSLAAGVPLPSWFQEGAAVYFSTGKERKLYNKTDDPRIIKDMHIPDDYKGDLRSFQFIESRMGTQKLYEFVRRAVETGEPDPRAALGMKEPVAQEKASVSRLPIIIGIVIIGVIAIIVFAWLSLRRGEEEDWRP